MCYKQALVAHIPFVTSTYSAGLIEQTYFLRNLADPSIKYNLSAESKDG